MPVLQNLKMKYIFKHLERKIFQRSQRHFSTAALSIDYLDPAQHAFTAGSGSTLSIDFLDPAQYPLTAGSGSTTLGYLDPAQYPLTAGSRSTLINR